MENREEVERRLELQESPTPSSEDPKGHSKNTAGVRPWRDLKAKDQNVDILLCFF